MVRPVRSVRLRPCLISNDLSPTKEAPVLEEFMGLPAHPILIHAAVVFVPLLAALAIIYAFVPFARPHTRWVLGLLALAAPVAALLAKLSGDAFFRRLQSRGVGPDSELYPKIQDHQELGTLTLYATIMLSILTLTSVYFVTPRGVAARAAGRVGSSRAVQLVLGVLSLVAAGVSLYYVIRTGDSGAKNVWSGS